MDTSTLKERAASILRFANSLSDALTGLGLPEPSFENGLPPALHKDAPDSHAGAARQSLLQELDEFRALLTEPTLLLTPELASLPRAPSPRDRTLTTDSSSAQPKPQRPLHRPPRYCRKLPSAGKYRTGSRGEAWAGKESGEAIARPCSNASHLPPSVAGLLREHCSVEGSRRGRGHAEVDPDWFRGADSCDVEGIPFSSVTQSPSTRQKHHSLVRSRDSADNEPCLP